MGWRGTVQASRGRETREVRAKIRSFRCRCGGVGGGVVSLMEKYNPLSLVGISRGPREWGNEFVILCRGEEGRIDEAC